MINGKQETGDVYQLSDNLETISVDLGLHLST